MTLPYRIKLSAAVAAALLALAGGVGAQPRGPDGHGPPGARGDRHDGGPRGGGPDRFHDGHQDLRPDRMADRRGFPQPRRDWRAGGYVPREYRGRNYVVDDWRGYGLRPPPRGYQWVGVGGDFVLAAIATGLIASIISH